jgi:hypothetical protein
MSYLIQNTFSSAHTLKISLRVRSSFIARNAPTVYTCLYTNTEAFRIPSNPYSYSSLIMAHSLPFFTRFYNTLFPNPKFLRFIPFGINFPISAHYTAIQIIKNRFEGNTPLVVFPTYTQNTFNYPYFTRPQVAITNVSKSPFSLALHKLLRLSLSLWFVWPRGYKVNLNYTDITKSWLMLRFLNKYFFKVYSV